MSNGRIRTCIWIRPDLKVLDRTGSGITNSVVDSKSLNPDPDTDPAFQVNPNPDTDPDPGFWWPKIEEKFLNGRPSYRRSLQPPEENNQHFKKWNCLTFSIFVGRFCPHGTGSSPDPEPHHWLQSMILNNWMSAVRMLSCLFLLEFCW